MNFLKKKDFQQFHSVEAKEFTEKISLLGWINRNPKQGGVKIEDLVDHERFRASNRL
jgi:aspartyl-tRNA synthetase